MIEITLKCSIAALGRLFKEPDPANRFAHVHTKKKNLSFALDFHKHCIVLIFYNEINIKYYVGTYHRRGKMENNVHLHTYD